MAQTAEEAARLMEIQSLGGVGGDSDYGSYKPMARTPHHHCIRCGECLPPEEKGLCEVCLSELERKDPSEREEDNL